VQAGVAKDDIFSVTILRGSILAVVVTKKEAAPMILSAASSGTMTLRGAPAAVVQDSSEGAGDGGSSSAAATYAGAGVGAFVLVLILSLLVVRQRNQASGRGVVTPETQSLPPTHLEGGVFTNPVYSDSRDDNDGYLVTDVDDQLNVSTVTVAM
jgi:hypothetical protein